LLKNLKIKMKIGEKMKLEEIALAGIPLSGLILLQRIAPLRVTVTAVAGTKKKGIDSFKVRVRIKNTGDVDISNWSVYATATHGSESVPIGSMNISLAKGEEKNFPSDTTYFETLVPATASTGTWDCLVVVVDAPVGQSGTAKASKTVTGAWDVVEPVKAVEITSVTVA
jgi:hypothetical protein